MSPSLRRKLIGLLIAVLFGVLIHIGVSRSDAQAQATPQTAGWDYRTEEVDVSVLQATLVTLGRDGWEVADILHVDQTVQSDADGQAHLRSGRALIVVKRPLAK